MFGSLGFAEIAVILFLIMLLFGPKKLPEIGRSLGKGLREFKKSTSGLMDSINVDLNEPVQAAPPPAQPAQPASAQEKPAAATPPPQSEPVAKKATVIDLEKDGDQG